MTASQSTSLHKQVLHSADYFALYEGYQPDLEMLAQIAASGVRAQVRIYYDDVCGECARHLPALARIAEHLPGWRWEAISADEAMLKELECGLSTPVIVVGDDEGELLGTINGRPLRGSLEADLLHFVSKP